MHSVVALALPDVVAVDLTITGHVFGHRTHRRRYSFEVCAPMPGPVPTTTGFEVHAAHGLEALAAADTVVVPGFAPYDAPGEEVLDALRAAHARGARVASVCTGAFALAAAGLLDGRRATTHWADATELARRHPEVEVDPDELYVDEGARAAGRTAHGRGPRAARR